MRELDEIEFAKVVGGCPCDGPDSTNIGCCCDATVIQSVGAHYDIKDMTQSFYVMGDGSFCQWPLPLGN